MEVILLLFGDSDGSSSSSGRFGVLTSDPETPVMSQTPMSSDLLQSLQILTQLCLQVIRHNLHGNHFYVFVTMATEYY